MSAPVADLSRLNESERRVLALLAAGHTAKSAAAETGTSVNAVNERLREARRKTGVGSSRELARMVGPQEIGDEFIAVDAVPEAADIGAAPTASSGHRRRPVRELSVMIVLLAALAVAFFVAQQPAAPTVDAPVTMTYAPADALRQRLGREGIDAAWAPGAEATLQAIYARIKEVGDVGVTCGKSVCEVTGAIVPGEEARAVEAVQAPDIAPRVAAAGFAGDPVVEFTTGMGGGTDTRSRFAILWHRAADARESRTSR